MGRGIVVLSVFLVDVDFEVEKYNAIQLFICMLTAAAAPAVGKILEYFKLLGRAMAKALQDNRLLDIPLSYVFYRCALPN